MRRFIAVLQGIAFLAVIFLGVGASLSYANNGQPLIRNSVDHHDKTLPNHFVYLCKTDLEEKENLLKFEDIEIKPYSICSVSSDTLYITLTTFENPVLRQLSTTVILS